MRHWILRRRLLLLWIFFALTMLVLVLVRSSSNDLDRWKQMMSERGEHFSLKDIVAPFSPATADWEATFATVAERLVERPHPAGEIAFMSTNGAGFAPSVVRRADPTGRHLTNFWSEFTAQITTNAPAIAEARGLIRVRPSGSLIDPDSPFRNTYNFMTRRKVVHALSGATAVALRQEDFDQAVTNVATLVAMAQPESGETITESAIRTAIAFRALELTWEICQLAGSDELRLHQLSRLWRSQNLLSNLAHVMETERAIGEFCFGIARTNLAMKRALFVAPHSQPFTKRIREAAIDLAWRRTSIEKDEHYFLRTMQPLVEGARTASTNGAYVEMQARWLEHLELLGKTGETKLSRFRYSLTLDFTPNSGKFLSSLWKTEAFRRVTLAAIAVKRFQLLRGRLPQSLEALVPEFLSVEPGDPFSGPPLHPLRYRVVSAGEFVLNSVGENGRDDGGLGDDVYWPRLVNPTD